MGHVVSDALWSNCLRQYQTYSERVLPSLFTVKLQYVSSNGPFTCHPNPPHVMSYSTVIKISGTLTERYLSILKETFITFKGRHFITLKVYYRNYLLPFGSPTFCGIKYNSLKIEQNFTQIHFWVIFVSLSIIAISVFILKKM